MMSPDARDALLVALVLAPATYSRNRFYELYAREPEARRVRRRASMIRSVVRHVASADPQRHGDIIATEPHPTGGVSLTYVVPAMGLRRTTVLDVIEMALIRYAIARASGSALAADDVDRARIEAAAHGLTGFAIEAPEAIEIGEEHGAADGGA
jgi:hypothetical protein